MRNVSCVAGFVLLAALSTLAAADDYTLNWSTLDAGGGMLATDGTYVLSATIGQVDAAPVMTDGTYTLAGGFWPGAYSDIFGDCDNSWGVSLDDLAELADCLQGPEVPIDPACGCLNPDANGDNDCDLGDFVRFQAVFAAGG